MQFPVDIPFHLFSSCIPVKGTVRSAIYDLQREDFEYIPNSLYDILFEFKNISYSNLLDKFETIEDKKNLEDYFNFLFQKEFIFFSKLNCEFFPEYNIEYFKPYNFSCLIIDIKVIHLEYLKHLKIEITNSKVECIVFRFIDPTENNIETIVKLFNDIPVRTIQLFVDDKKEIINSFFEKIILLNNRVSTILKYNSKKEAVKKIQKGIVISSKRDVLNSKMKINSIADFDVNMELFMESKLYNNFYNKRAYIDLKGDVYRTENDLVFFGNINSSSLLNIAKEKKFKEFWNITKDKIEICKDCEYRYMCVDNRLPLFKNDSNLWVLEGVCNYDPYKAIWK